MVGALRAGGRGRGGSWSPAEIATSMALEEARAEVARLKTEKYLAEQALEQERKAKAKDSFPNQILHDKIQKENADVIDTIKEVDNCSSWWVKQWVNERLTDLATSDTQKFKSYVDYVMRNKKKKEVGINHLKVTPFSTPAKGVAAGSD